MDAQSVKNSDTAALTGGVRDILVENITVQIAKRSELHTVKAMPKRRIVERSFAWLEKNRRLWKNCERLLQPAIHPSRIHGSFA